MREAARIGIKAVRLANNIVNIAILSVIMILLAFGFYTIWDSRQVYGAADAARYAIYKPDAEKGILSFQGLQAINPDVIAWLTVFGTNIDYPVVQGENNMKYINTNAKGAYSISGAIFLDSSNSPDFSDFSNIIHGHHMDRQIMFGGIYQFTDKDYFDARQYGMLFHEEQEHGLEFFAFIHTDANDEIVYRTNITEQHEQQEYLDMLLGAALNNRESTGVTTNDRLVLLSTCSDNTTNGRDILIGRITGEVYADPFESG